MIDFAKLRGQPRFHVTYRCPDCGIEEVYAWEMPKDWRHFPPGSRRQCKRPLVEVKREPR